LTGRVPRKGTGSRERGMKQEKGLLMDWEGAPSITQCCCLMGPGGRQSKHYFNLATTTSAPLPPPRLRSKGQQLQHPRWQQGWLTAATAGHSWARPSYLFILTNKTCTLPLLAQVKTVTSADLFNDLFNGVCRTLRGRDDKMHL